MAECNAAKTLETAILEEYVTDVMTGDRDKRRYVTVQQVCAFTALTVRKHGLAGKNPIAEGNFQWIFARNCEGTEQLRRYLYYQLIHSMRKADRIDIIVSFLMESGVKMLFARTEKGYEAWSEGSHSDWKLSWHYAAIGLVSD